MKTPSATMENKDAPITNQRPTGPRKNRASPAPRGIRTFISFLATCINCLMKSKKLSKLPHLERCFASIRYQHAAFHPPFSDRRPAFSTASWCQRQTARVGFDAVRSAVGAGDARLAELLRFQARVDMISGPMGGETRVLFPLSIRRPPGGMGVFCLRSARRHAGYPGRSPWLAFFVSGHGLSRPAAKCSKQSGSSPWCPARRCVA